MKKKRIGVVIASLGYLWSRPYLGTALNWAFKIIFFLILFSLSAVDGQSKREVLGIFNMNQKKCNCSIFFSETGRQLANNYDFY